MSVIPKDKTEQASPNKTKTVREVGSVDISLIRDEILNLPEDLWIIQNDAKPNQFQPLV